ncbi:MAG: histidine kinase, partial [Streptococcaceae bacterium]|nr:histidine kinase [Streptococcaceae bacterium]
MKTSIIRTFALVFSVIIIVGLLCITLISGLDFNQIVEHFKGNVYGLWVFVSVAAALALILTIFNYFENNQLQEKQKRNLQALVNNQKPDENDTEMMVIYNRMSSLSNQLQELSNQQSADKAEIIETERKRISRELHDSVSQELFAATMILSSVTGDEVSVANMSKDQILAQTNLVQKILHEAQSEMRALLLHLRPIELEGKSLSEGLTGLTDELQAKISAHISVKLSDIKASSNIEDNLFRM